MEFKIKNNGKSVWENFIEQNLNVPSFCGGRGSCGKCKILVTEGLLPVTAEDKKVFSKQQLEQGYRLACRAYPESEITIKTVFLEKRQQERKGTPSSRRIAHQDLSLVGFYNFRSNSQAKPEVAFPAAQGIRPGSQMQGGSVSSGRSGGAKARVSHAKIGRKR